MTVEQDLTRRRVLALGSASVGVSALGLAPVRAATPVALQLSWLHSVQFAGSYIAQDQVLECPDIACKH